MCCVTIWEHLRTQLRTSRGYFQGVTLVVDIILAWTCVHSSGKFIMCAGMYRAVSYENTCVMHNMHINYRQRLSTLLIDVCGIQKHNFFPCCHQFFFSWAASYKIWPITIEKWFTSYSVDTSQGSSYLLTSDEAGRSLWSSPLAYAVIRQKARKSAFHGSSAA